MKAIFQILPAALLIVGAFYLALRGMRSKPSGSREDTDTVIDRHLGSNAGNHLD